jgi:hypothetical protein
MVVLFFSGCKQKQDQKEVELKILQDEKWWGGAVLDGRNSPYFGGNFFYNQIGDCKGNQAQPLFLSNRGRYIWSEKPMEISIKDEIISVRSHGAEIITGTSGETLKDAFLYCSKTFFPPSGMTPDPLMFTNPQYNTWIELQYDQNEKDVIRYAEDIIKNGFPSGVLMIDDNWQDRYGTWEFDCKKFSDPASMMEKLHRLGFRVMLWVCPFISSDSPFTANCRVRSL